MNLKSFFNSQPYPVDAYPVVIRNAILEVQNNLKSPVEMIGSSFLAGLSLAMQNKINVSRLNDLIGPVCLDFMSVADSGERKTCTCNLVLKPIYQLEEKLYSKYQEEYLTYKAALAVHEAKQKMILSTIRQGDDAADTQKKLAELLLSKPTEPTRIRFIFNDATPAAIKDYLCGDWRSIGLVSDEASTILNGHAFKELSFINKLWDGATLPIDRKGSPNALIKNARLTISLLTQTEALDEFLKRKGDMAKGIGFFARFFVCRPFSTQGSRFIANAVTSTEHLPIFHNRLMELALESLNVCREEDRVCLKFSPAAQSRWILFFNSTEQRIGVLGDLSEFKDMISKLSDNVARVAALLHYFSGDEGDIPLNIVESAISISCWYADEYIKIFGKKQESDLLASDSYSVYQWLLEYCSRHRVTCLTMTEALRYGPNRFRNSARLRVLLNYLLSQGMIKGWRQGRIKYIEPIINPTFTW